MPVSSRSAIRCAAALAAVALAWPAAATAEEVPAATVALAMPQSPLAQTVQAAPEVLVAVPASVAAPAAALMPALWLKMALDDKVAFAGRPNDDGGAVNTNGTNMAYPAANALTFLVAVATHGVLASKDLERRKQEREDRSNLILLPYRPLLDQYKYGELAQAWVDEPEQPRKRALLQAGAAPGPGDLVIESQPRYQLTQDQRAIIMDNAVVITRTGEAQSYKAVIRVVSDDIGENAEKARVVEVVEVVQPAASGGETLATRKVPATQRAWTNGAGRKLKQESAHLLAMSLELALQGMQADAKQEAVQKTLRYREGGVETIARGQLVSEDCGRIYFKSLRDEMISAPKASSSCMPDK